MGAHERLTLMSIGLSVSKAKTRAVPESSSSAQLSCSVDGGLYERVTLTQNVRQIKRDSAAHRVGHFVRELDSTLAYSRTACYVCHKS